MTSRTTVLRKNWNATSSSHHDRYRVRLMTMFIFGFIGAIIFYQQTYHSYHDNIDSISFYDSLLEDHLAHTSVNTKASSTNIRSLSLMAAPIRIPSNPILENEKNALLQITNEKNNNNLDEKDVEEDSKIHVVINAGCNPLQDCKCHSLLFLKTMQVYDLCASAAEVHGLSR
jgi:hypothetical protein